MFNAWLQRLAHLAASESGVSASEYAILLGALILGAMGVIQSIGSSFQGIYTAIAAKIPAA